VNAMGKKRVKDLPYEELQLTPETIRQLPPKTLRFVFGALKRESVRLAFPELTPETIRRARARRAAGDTPPDVEMLKAGLNSRSLAERLDAALLIAKFHTNPRIESLHRPLDLRAAKVIEMAQGGRSVPFLEAAAGAEISSELMELSPKLRQPVRSRKALRGIDSWDCLDENSPKN